MEMLKALILKKFEEIQKRMVLVIEQLSDEQVNWHPNNSSNSIANLIVHISGNIHERISKGMNKKDFVRDRDGEFEEMYKTKNELLVIINESFHGLIETTRNMTEEIWLNTQLVRNKERTNLDMLIQCMTHFSEHMGQILYIGRIIKDKEYITTSVPKKAVSND